MNVVIGVCIIFSISFTADGSADICYLKPDPGPCKRVPVERYFYNPGSGTCEIFLYNGCRGNANNFETLEDCLTACAFKEGICGINEEYTDHGSHCPITCANRNDPPRPCIAVGVIGCFCKKGYIRDNTGVCVTPEECPVDQCGINEEYQECGTACPKTCANRNIKIKCIAKCVEGCFCKNGFVRNDYGQCVNPNQCPPTEICGINEEYTDCGTRCPVTCANRNDPPRACPAICVEGCFCKRGYIRNDEGICVIPEECPADECGPKEEYQECGTGCPKTCANRHIKINCIAKCVEGCFCKKGLVRNDYGQCVNPNQCPPTEKCGLHEVYTKCGSACPKTCSDLYKPPVMCPAVCVEGCFCKKGYVRNDDGVCVDPDHCLIGGFGFCPVKEDIVCIQCYDNCFFDGDCPIGYVCCKENCGNTCRPASSFPTSGQPAIGPSC